MESGRVDLDLDVGEDDPRVAELLLGPLQAAALRQRGLAVLHASAVVAGGGAVAILGASGAGKSTLAGHLVSLGNRLLADDVLAVDDANLAHPSGRDLRLHPAVAAGLQLAVEGAAVGDKVRVTAPRAETAAPLRHLYVLGRRGVIAGGPALAVLVAGSWLPDLDLDPEEGGHLRRLAALARAVPMTGVRPPRTPSGWRRLARRIDGDARA